MLGDGTLIKMGLGSIMYTFMNSNFTKTVKMADSSIQAGLV